MTREELLGRPTDADFSEREIEVDQNLATIGLRLDAFGEECTGMTAMRERLRELCGPEQQA